MSSFQIQEEEIIQEHEYKLGNIREHYKGCLLHNIGEGNGTPLQYCCLENPMDGGAWWAPVHGVAKSQTQLSDFTFTHFNIVPILN